MNDSPPYEITPDDLSLELFQRNKRPSYATLMSGVAAGRIISLRDPKHFRIDTLRPVEEVDADALKKGMLIAPSFYFDLDIIDLIDRMFDFVMREDSIRESAIRDHPDFDPENPDPEMRKLLRQELLVTFVQRALTEANAYTIGFAKERIKAGLDPDIHSMVSVFPDLKGFDTVTLSLVNLFYINGEGADTHCYINLMRP